MLDVVSPIDKDDRALRATLAMLRAFSLGGVRFSCILLDELEAIQLLHPWRKQRLLNNLRRLIDSNPAGLCLIMSCAPDAWSSIIREYHAFSERIFREVVLKPLDKEEAKSLITSYLRVQRSGSKTNGSQLYPFTDDAISEILLASQGNTRRVLMICNRAVDTGSRNGFQEISKSFLKKYLPDIFITT